MKRIAVALFALAGTFGVGNVFAQQEYPVKATIPFNFTVGSKVLPSGTYSVLQVNETAIEIRNTDGSATVLSSADLTGGQFGDQYMGHAVMVFNKYGDQYFLRQVAGGPGAVNDNLPLSRAEEKARSHEDIALNQISIPASEGN